MRRVGVLIGWHRFEACRGTSESVEKKRCHAMWKTVGQSSRNLVDNIGRAFDDARNNRLGIGSVMAKTRG